MTALREVLGETLLGFDHVGLAVDDLEASIATWESMGLTMTHREINYEQGVDEAMIAVPGGTFIQLLSPLTQDTTIGHFLAKHGEGMQQMAFRVTDIEQAMTLVLKAGKHLIYPEPRIGTNGSRINFLHPSDMGGILIELVEHVA
ncbi:MAG: methylmalonyl-CoA epimerase [Actinomycetes bacterium]